MVKSKAWNWGIAKAPEWEQPAPEVYPLVARWQKINFKNLLDLGSGVGRHSFLFAKNGFEVDAFDLSREGSEQIAKVAKVEHLPIRVKIGDMLSLPYKDNSFDCLIAFHTIYHTDDTGIKKVLEEIKRVLRSGGEAFITFISKNNSSFKNPDNKHLSENTAVKTQGHEANILHYYANKNEVENLLSGFEIIEYSYKEEYYKEGYWQGQNFTGAHYFALVKKTKDTRVESLKESPGIIC